MAQDIEDKVINHLATEYFLVNVFDSRFTESMIVTRKVEVVRMFISLFEVVL